MKNVKICRKYSDLAGLTNNLDLSISKVLENERLFKLKNNKNGECITISFDEIELLKSLGFNFKWEPGIDLKKILKKYKSKPFIIGDANCYLKCNEITNKYDQLKSTILDYNPIINANKKATLNNLLGNINEVNYPIMLRRPPLRSLNEGYDLAKMNNIALNKNYADSVYQTANSGLSEVDKQAINSKNYAENLKASYNNIPNTTKYFNDIQNSNRDVTFTNESNQYNYDMQVLPRYEQQLGNVQKGLYQSKKENMDTINKYHNFNADFKMRMNDQQMINDLIDNGDGTYTYTPNKKFIIKNQADMQFLQFLYKVPESQRSQMIEYYKLTQWNNNFY